MKLLFDGLNTKVYDNVLDSDSFGSLFDFLNYHPYTFRQSHGEWNKVWNFSDGQILMGEEYIWPIGKVPPFKDERRILLNLIEKINSFIVESNLFDCGEISTISMTPYCWPPGTGLSWHNDSKYLGAITFYGHHYWSPEWGGEFVTCEANKYIIEDKNNITWKVFDNKELFDLLMEEGTGNYFYPKPNRMIINKGGRNGILHKVNKSTLNSNPRLTLQCFIRSK
jgi:hypothetical protein